MAYMPYASMLTAGLPQADPYGMMTTGYYSLDGAPPTQGGTVRPPGIVEPPNPSRPLPPGVDPGTPPGAPPGAPPGTAPTTPPGGLPGNLADIIKYLQGGVGTPQLPAGASDDLAKAYLAYYGQTGNTAMQQAINLALQQQQNQLRQAELFGADQSGASTDAATRWRKELEAQQAIQREKLRQEYSAQLGYAIDPGTGQMTGQTTSDERAKQAAAAQRWAELMGTGQGGAQTLAAKAQEAEIARRQAELLGTDAQGRQTMDKQRLENDAKQAAAERDLRMALQSGQLNQQESEFARTYLLQQAENRRQNAAQSGYMVDENGFATGALTEEARKARAAEALQAGGLTGTYNGQQTEEQRAAMAREALQKGTALGRIDGQQTEEQRAAMAREMEQRAQTAAGLTDNSKDVFKAANYFRAMQGGNNGLGASLGLGGGGVAGFTTAAQRAQGTPGTIGYGDIDVATGNAPGAGQMGQQLRAQEMRGGSMQAGGFAGGMSQQGGTGGGFSMGGDTSSTMQTSTDTSTERPEREQNVAAGMSPGGPVGMGAGGHFMGRLVSPEQQRQKLDAMRAALDHPMTKKMFRQMRDHMQATPGSEPGGPQIPPGKRNSFDGTLERDRRYIRGLKALQKRGLIPGSQPGGPVDAPMWPTGGSGAMEQPQSVPQPQSVGGAPQTQEPIQTNPAAPFAQADVGGMDQRLAAFQEYLTRYGLQGLGAQALEAQNSTDKGVTEGAFAALGLNPEDAMMAYAQTRFANTGNALMA